MKKSFFYPFIAAFLLLAFASCSSPFFSSAKSAKVSLRLNLPDKPESNIPEDILRDLADITSRNSPGSRLIHPEGNWLELEIKQGSKLLYSIAKGIAANQSQLQIAPIILPVKTRLNIEVRFYKKTGQGNEILLGSSDSELYLEDKEFSEILVGIKPVTAIPGGDPTGQGNSKDISFYVSGHSDNIYILKFTAGLENGIHKMVLDNVSTNHFNSVILYNEDGTKHKGAITGDEMGLIPGQGNSKNEIYFSLKGPENKCYVLLQASEDFEYGAINIFLTKLEDKLLVVAEKTWENISWTGPFIFSNGGKLNFKTVNWHDNNKKIKIKVHVYNPYQQDFPVSIELKDNQEPDFFQINLPPNQPIKPGKRLVFDALLNRNETNYSDFDFNSVTCSIESSWFDEFKMIFTGKQASDSTP